METALHRFEIAPQSCKLPIEAVEHRLPALSLPGPPPLARGLWRGAGNMCAAADAQGQPWPLRRRKGRFPFVVALRLVRGRGMIGVMVSIDSIFDAGSYPFVTPTNVTHLYRFYYVDITRHS